MYQSRDDNDNDSEFYLYSEKWESTAEEEETTSVAPEIARSYSSPRLSLCSTNIEPFNAKLICLQIINENADLRTFLRTTHFPTYVKEPNRTTFLMYVLIFCRRKCSLQHLFARLENNDFEI